MNKKIISLVFLLSLSLLSSCQSLNKTKVTTPKFNAGLSYTKVTFPNRGVWFVSSFSDAWPQQNTSVWYSSELEVMRFNNGRMVSYTNDKPNIQWQEILPQPINWQTVLRKQKQTIVKCHDFHPTSCKQYQLLTQGKPFIKDINTEDFIWVKEIPIKTNAKNAVNWFGFKKGNVVPSVAQQCIHNDLCVVWQRVN